MALPYDKLSAMPAVSESPDEELSMPLEGEEPEAEEPGLPPHLRALGAEMGLNPKQSAALKEFIAAAMLGDEEPELEL